MACLTLIETAQWRPLQVVPMARDVPYLPYLRYATGPYCERTMVPLTVSDPSVGIAYTLFGTRT